MSKSVEAFRTIAEVADDLAVPKHVLRFWEVKFPQIRPMKRGGGRRYYRPEDLELLRGIQALLHAEAYTIKGVQKILREHGVDHVKQFGREPLSIPGRKGAGQRKRAVADARPAVSDGGAAVGPATARSATATPAAASGSGASGAAARRAVTRPAVSASATRQSLQAILDELEACRALLRDDRQQHAAAGRLRAAR